MEFRVYFGAHRVGLDHLNRQLEANKNLLEDNGVLLPDYKVMEDAIWPAIKALRKGAETDQTLPKLIESLTGGKDYKSIIILRPALSGSPLLPLKGDSIYPRDKGNIPHLLRLIGPENLKLFGCIRNLANFLPSCYFAKFLSDPNSTFEDFIDIEDPFGMRWSDYLHRLRGRNSDILLHLWTFEDYPYIWRSVVQAVAGLPNKEVLIAAEPQPDLQEVSLKGIGLMQQYLKKHPTNDGALLQKITDKFAERFPPVDGETNSGLWSTELVQHLTHSYEDDLYYIERMGNVHMIKRPVYA